MRSVVLLLFLTACGAAPLDPALDPAPFAVRADGIVGGTLSGSGADPQVFLLLIDDGTQSALCSSTLIASHTLLTAAHCADGARTITAWNGNDFARMGRAGQPPTFAAVGARIHPQWNAQSLENDIALLLLDAAPAVTPKAWRGGALSQANVGAPVRLVGYGRTYTEDAGKKREVSVVIAGVEPTLVTFDQTNGKGGCQGDSGGPAFLKLSGGEERLIGVTSFGDQNCQEFGAYTRVDAYASFIDAWLTEHEPATCAEDGQCKAGCAPVDVDCACAADGECSTACPTLARDPDCPKTCGQDGTCTDVACPAPDPDCVAVGAACASAAVCSSRRCVSDAQHPQRYCTVSCGAGVACPSGLVCGNDGACLKPQLPEASRGEACTKGETFCAGGDVCAGEPATCSRICASDADCASGSQCSGVEGATKFCEATKVAQKVAKEAALSEEAPPRLVGGCSAGSASDASWSCLLILLAAARRRRTYP